jgi:hypothetical protein
MYARLPTDKELAGTELTVADYEEEAEVWPENWPAFRLFLLMQTQWDVGMAGRTGLKYQVLFDLMDRQQLSGDEWQEMFDDIRELETAALNAMHED